MVGQASESFLKMIRTSCRITLQRALHFQRQERPHSQRFHLHQMYLSIFDRNQAQFVLVPELDALFHWRGH